MQETEDADQVTVIDAGRAVASGTPSALRAKYSRSLLTVTTSDPASLLRLAEAADAIAERKGATLTIAVADGRQAQRILAAHGNAVQDFEFRHGRMDDVFLALTGAAHADVDVP